MRLSDVVVSSTNEKKTPSYLSQQYEVRTSKQTR